MSESFVEAIFIASAAGQPMQQVREIEAIAGSGLAGDRYAIGTGYYSPHDECEVTLIEGEDLDQIATLHGMQIYGGEHRRNIVTRGVALRGLRGHHLRIGDVVLKYCGPRPPCGYVERITEKGMTRALGEGSGICACVLASGVLREGADIELIDSGEPPPRRLP